MTDPSIPTSPNRGHIRAFIKPGVLRYLRFQRECAMAHGREVIEERRLLAAFAATSVLAPRN